jgi:hypothetical protein
MWSVIIYQIGKEMKLIQRIHVTLKPGIVKISCQILRSYDATASCTIVGVCSVLVNYLAQAEKQFLHSLCILSRLPSITGQSQEELMLRTG